MNPFDLALTRFKPVKQAHERHLRAQQAHADAVARVTELQAELPQAEAADRRGRGDALVDGKSAPASKADAIRAKLEAAQHQQADLEDAVHRAADEIPKTIAKHERGWFGEGIRGLSKAATRYRDAIEELKAARAGLSDEASLAVWISTHGRDGADAANDVLTGRLGAKPGEAQPLSFGLVIRELEADAEQLSAHPVEHDAPPPVPNLAEIRRAS